MNAIITALMLAFMLSGLAIAMLGVAWLKLSFLARLAGMPAKKHWGYWIALVGFLLLGMGVLLMAINAKPEAELVPVNDSSRDHDSK